MTTASDTAATFCATLVDEWILQGVAHAVIAPGSRSTPLALELCGRSEISVHVFHDERSASFAALGIGLDSGIPAVLLCTSGTAATHFHAAVAEADLSNVPMIVCTADRPPELRDVGAPQTIDQTNLFGNKVRWFHDPGVASEDARHTWRSLASRTFSNAVSGRPGPVHVNLPFREPLVGVATALPPTHNGKYSQVIQGNSVDKNSLAQVVAICAESVGVIVAGRGCTRSVIQLAQSLGWPVLADARSGVRELLPEIVIGFDPILRSTVFASQNQPEVVIRIGEPPASKVLSQWISQLDARIIQIQSYDNVIDPDHSVEHTVIGDVDAILLDLSSLATPCKSEWLRGWRTADDAAQKAITAWASLNKSEPSVARAITEELSAHSRFVVSSSMPIRDVEWFGAPTPNVVVHSNRGANGIDGVVSTAVGVALASGAPTTLLIGDVAALHDANGLLGIMKRSIDLTIVVSNNDGGSIFSFLPQAATVDSATFETVYGTPHGVSFSSLANAYGVPYLSADSAIEVGKAVRSRGTKLVEVRSRRGENVADHEALNASIVAAIENLE